MTQTMLPPQQTQTQPVYEIGEQDKKRQERIMNAWRAYHGELDKPLKQMPGQPDDNVLSNRCKAVVQAGKGFLFGKELEISVEENAPQEAQAFLDLVWGRKEQRIPLLQKLAMNGAMSGLAFLRIVPSAEQPGRDTTYRLVPVDPSIVVGIETAPQDCETVLLYCIQYSQVEKDPNTGKPRVVYYREEIMRIDPDGNASKGMPDDDDTWAIQHWTQISQGMNFQPKPGLWVPAGEPILWNYPFPPLFRCQNLVSPNDPWGEPDITDDLIGINNALNLVQSSVNRIEKIYGGPVVWAKGVGESTIDLASGCVVVLPPSPDSGMGSVPIVSDTPNALSFAETLRSDMDELTRTPGVATGRIKDMPRGNLSGIAIELLFQSLLMKTEEKRCTYGELIIDVSRALLVLNGLSDDIDIQLAWQNPLPHDDLPAVQAAISKREIGISDTTLMRELGYDPEEEVALSQAEDEQKIQAMQATLPPQLPGAPLLPGQPPPAPAAPAGTPPTAIGGKPA